MFEKLVPVRSEAESGLIFIGIYGECGDRTEGAVTGIGIEGMDRRLVLVIVSVFIVPGLGCGAEIGGPFKPGFLEGLLDRVLAISVVGGMKSIASISFLRPPPAQESIQRSGMSMSRSSQKRRYPWIWRFSEMTMRFSFPSISRHQAMGKGPGQKS